MKKLFILLILVLFAPILFLKFQTDANVFAYIGRVLVDEGVPYIDAWDHKGIFIYLINALGYLVFGLKSMTGIRILELILILMAFLRFFTQMRKKKPVLVVFIAGAFGLFTLKYFFDGGNLTEEYGAIFSLISALLILKERVKPIDMAIVGALFVVNFTIRANLIGFWAALFMFYVAKLLLRQKTFKEILLSFLKMGYGALVVGLVLLGYFWLTDSFQAFIDAAFTFNFSYSDSSSSKTLNAIFMSAKRYRLAIILIIGWLLCVFRFFKDKKRMLELLLIFWIPIELYFSNISGKLFAHYFMMWMPLIMFSIIILFDGIKERFPLSNMKIIVLAFILFCPLYYVPMYKVMMDWKKVVLPATSKKMITVKHVNQNYADKSILVWGNSPFIYNETNKTSPVSYFYHSTFKYNSEVIQKISEDFADQVLEKKPDLIIDGKRPGLLQLDRSNISEIGQGQIQNVTPFLNIIDTYYELKETYNGLSYYTLKKNE